MEFMGGAKDQGANMLYSGSPMGAPPGGRDYPAPGHVVGRARIEYVKAIVETLRGFLSRADSYLLPSPPPS